MSETLSKIVGGKNHLGTMASKWWKNIFSFDNAIRGSLLHLMAAKLRQISRSQIVFSGRKKTSFSTVKPSFAMEMRSKVSFNFMFRGVNSIPVGPIMLSLATGIDEHLATRAHL